MSIVIHWLMMVLGVFGVIELTGMLSVWWYRPKNPPDCMTVIPVKGELENAEQVLGYLKEVAQWSPESQRALLVDCGLDPHSRHLCEMLCQEDDRVEFCSWEKLASVCKEKGDVLY